MPAPVAGGTAFHLICASLGLVILAMTVNEWRRLRTGEYQRIALAAGALLLGRVAGLGLSAIGRQEVPCQEWILEGLTLAFFTWGFLFKAFSHPRRAFLFLAVALAVVAIAGVVCFLGTDDRSSLTWTGTLWPATLGLLNVFALGLWLRYRQHSSWWLGAAFLASSLGLAAGLLGFPQVAPFGHLAALPLFAVETYRCILTDLNAYADELQTVSEGTLQQTQDMALLLEVGQAVTASLDLPVVLERVLESVARAVNADWAYVLLPQENDPEELTVAARYGWWGRRWAQESQISRQVIIRLADFSLLRHAVLRQRQVMANEPEDYEQFARLHEILSRPQSGPTLVQPIYIQERPLGAVVLGHTNVQQTFNDADGKLCQALVQQVATAIDNARLYQSVDEHAHKLAGLLWVREEEATQRQAILESIADGVVVTNEAEEVVVANAAAERILGMPRDKLAGQTVRRLYAALLRAGRQKSGEPAVFQWGDREVTGSLAPVTMPNGAMLGYVAVFRDVTPQRQSERAKATFIATISHELRTPLTSMKGYIELLAAGAVGLMSPQQLKFLQVISNNTERLVGLVNNLIAASEIERGTIEVQARPVDMKGVIEEAVRAIQPQVAENELNLAVNVPSDLCPVSGDPQQLRQVMDNLLNNALHYTRAGGRIAVWAAVAHLENQDATSRAYVVVSVRDTGVGIPAEEHAHIFEKFYRAENPLSVEAGGTGMGLAIVRSLVEAHGGRVWVESKVGEGSTFSFTVPAAMS